MSNERVKIKNRLFYKLPVTIISPVSISNGNASSTNHDVLLTQDGCPFIPGTSVAGAILNYLQNIGLDNHLLFEVFGKANGENLSMSRIFISDIVFENGIVSVRDGVRLDENKTVIQDDKYNYQIVEPGAFGHLKLEYVLFENDHITSGDAKNLTLHIISGIKNGEIRFGYKKQRGLGVLDISEKYGFKEFNYSDIDPNEYQNFLENKKYDEMTITQTDTKYTDNITISLPLTQNGGISIRTYSAEPNAPDFAHIQSNHKAVIPGSSWNGAIRTRALDMLQNSLSAPESVILEFKKIWGELGEKEFILSQILINESIINEQEHSNGGFVNITRNKINRFDNSTVDRALYSETAFFNGTTKLTITIQNISKNAWAAGIIILVLADISNGLLAVGGQTSVGRGIFNGNFRLDDYSDYIKSLYQKLKGENVNG